MRTVSLRRAAENRIRRALLPRDDTRCECQLEGCQGRATDLHEVKTRARGGSITDQSNAISVCRSCHCTITRLSGKSQWAIRHGWVAASWATESDELRAAEVRWTFRCGTECEEDHR